MGNLFSSVVSHSSHLASSSSSSSSSPCESPALKESLSSEGKKPATNVYSSTRAKCRRATLAGIPATIWEPYLSPSGYPSSSSSSAPPSRGVTFLLPGSFVKISEYESTKNVLLERGQVVISIYINVLFKSHDDFAHDVARMFREYCDDHPDRAPKHGKYNVVGHSVGAKIALLLAAEVDRDCVNVVLCLDPVDLCPAQFTDATRQKLTLRCNRATSITLTWATSTSPRKIPPSHNSASIYENNAPYRGVMPLERHRDAAHFAYTDHGGGLPGLLIRGGTKEGNAMARQKAHDLIRQLI